MPVGPEWQHPNPPQRQAGPGCHQPSQGIHEADAVGHDAPPLGCFKAKRCQPPNLGELGELLAAETATGW